ncbi:hypothetical protein EV182_000268 [Spiromyces aspiralis]|uniref:Uncharacterized protein n=1 Tax=Spiromyces aspiralis TaxID=68401 RepID=A0ACC1HKR4_9FUNG|nr:hypothetical protein EV182_000268 [Spiromyces aspiralis]
MFFASTKLHRKSTADQQRLTSGQQPTKALNPSELVRRYITDSFRKEIKIDVPSKLDKIRRFFKLGSKSRQLTIDMQVVCVHKYAVIQAYKENKDKLTSKQAKLMSKLPSLVKESNTFVKMESAFGRSEKHGDCGELCKIIAEQDVVVWANRNYAPYAEIIGRGFILDSCFVLVGDKVYNVNFEPIYQASIEQGIIPTITPLPQTRSDSSPPVPPEPSDNVSPVANHHGNQELAERRRTGVIAEEGNLDESAMTFTLNGIVMGENGEYLGDDLSDILVQFPDDPTRPRLSNADPSTLISDYDISHMHWLLEPIPNDYNGVPHEELLAYIHAHNLTEHDAAFSREEQWLLGRIPSQSPGIQGSDSLDVMEYDSHSDDDQFHTQDLEEGHETTRHA